MHQLFYEISWNNHTYLRWYNIWENRKLCLKCSLRNDLHISTPLWATPFQFTLLHLNKFLSDQSPTEPIYPNFLIWLWLITCRISWVFAEICYLIQKWSLFHSIPKNAHWKNIQQLFAKLLKIGTTLIFLNIAN